MDTIYALASARGKSGIAVVRLSGPKAFSAVSQLAGKLPEGRKATLCKLHDLDVLLDEAVVVTFPGPASFTGEDVAELHLHGAVATVNSVVQALGRISGCRLAEPGEFTRRALENEKLDLNRVEGLSDLIEAETEAQRRQALRVFSGELGQKAESWRFDLLRAAALLEATIDFADEDVPIDVYPEVKTLLVKVHESLAAEREGSKVAERVREGFEVAIVGPPNVGKSTLLNALAGREAAIVSEVAGTTRDIIEIKMDLGGLPVTFLDTAGIRTSEDQIEQIGVQRAIDRALQADLRLVLLPSRGDVPLVDVCPGDIVVVTKSDLQDGDISPLSGDGLKELVESISREFEHRAASVGVATRERHRIAIESAAVYLERCLGGIDGGITPDELVADELRCAINALDGLVGRIDVEHLLGEIFSSFCIGK